MAALITANAPVIDVGSFPAIADLFGSRVGHSGPGRAPSKARGAASSIRGTGATRRRRSWAVFSAVSQRPFCAGKIAVVRAALAQSLAQHAEVPGFVDRYR